MSAEVVINNFTKDYFPFEFQGFIGPAHCFLRVIISNSNVFVLCAQLKEYRNTSVTNGLESIVDQLVSTLMEERLQDGNPVLKVVEKFAFLRSLTKSPEELRKIHHATARQRFMRRCRWFEYYPPGAGIADEGSLSLVTFSESGSPSWSYGTPKHFASEFPPEAFEINVDLSSWTAKAN